MWLSANNVCVCLSHVMILLRILAIRCIAHDMKIFFWQWRYCVCLFAVCYDWPANTRCTMHFAWYEVFLLTWSLRAVGLDTDLLNTHECREFCCFPLQFAEHFQQQLWSCINMFRFRWTALLEFCFGINVVIEWCMSLHHAHVYQWCFADDSNETTIWLHTNVFCHWIQEV